MAVHLAVSLFLDLLHVLAGKRGGAKGDRGQEGDRLPPFLQAAQEFLSAGSFRQIQGFLLYGNDALKKSDFQRYFNKKEKQETSMK